MRFFYFSIIFLVILLINLVASIDSIRESSEGQVLKKILDKYNQNVKPPTGNATIVTVNTVIRRIPNICSKNQEYTLQLTFRQDWHDPRLAFQSISALDYITITNENLIWIPDLFFSNGLEAKTHSILKPNVMIRIFSNGNVEFSERVTVVLSCPMNLRSFPFDYQSCPMTIASYSYKEDELKVEWKKNNPIEVNPNLNLRNFVLKGNTTGYGTRKTDTGKYAYIELILKFKRLTNYYIYTIYIPSAMIVLVSWLSFWIDVKLMILKCIISLFSLISLTLSLTFINNSLPHASYSKAVDLWTGVCLTFIFASLVESIIVYYRHLSNTNNSTENQLDKNANEITLANNEFAKKYLPFIIDSKSDQIDCISRCVFPILFFLFVIIYFLVFCC